MRENSCAGFPETIRDLSETCKDNTMRKQRSDEPPQAVDQGSRTLGGSVS